MTSKETCWKDTALDAEKRRKHPLISSFQFGFEGIAAAARERNVQIHFGISVFVILSGFLFEINKYEWIAVILCIAGMVSLEMMNTAIERTVDMYTEEFHPLAKQAKDIAAGAVLIFAIASVITGLIIFLPKISAWFR